MTKQRPADSEAPVPHDDTTRGRIHDVAPDIGYQQIEFVNVVFYGLHNARDREWLLIDAGVPGSANQIVDAAADRFGRNSRPAAILLTHAHLDHTGGLKELADQWQAPVYAHELELPYLDGRSIYREPDPFAGGGLMANLSKFCPRGPVDVRPWLKTLSKDGTVPEMPGWLYLHTPGHSAGHVSFWREADRTLIVGDAFITTRQQSAYGGCSQAPELHGPPMHYTPDWREARMSVERLTSLDPELVICSHGPPMRGKEMREALHLLAQDFDYAAATTPSDYARSESAP